jgi:hypothetical protein
MAVAASGNYFTFNGVKWIGPTALDGNSDPNGGLSGVSCTSSSFCMAVDSTKHFMTWDGTHWRIHRNKMYSQGFGIPNAVSCVSETFCVAVDNTGLALAWSGGKNWGTTQMPTDSHANLTSVSCANTSFCAAVDTNGDAFNGTSAGSISSINPTTGPASGGTKVVISGSGFTGAENVYFGQTSATTFTVNSDSQITATAPPGTGQVAVTVTTSSGTSPSTPKADFTYVPSVTSISPTSGPVGQSITIYGGEFGSTPIVEVGTTKVTPTTVNSKGTSMTAIVPLGSGTEPVYVLINGVQAFEKPILYFTYTPTISGYTPTSGPATGGTTVTITGAGFSSAVPKVLFGSTPGTNVSVAQSSKGENITVTSPAGVGTVLVTLTEPNSSSPISVGQFTYTPVIISVSPTSGPATGGTPVTITGAGFSAKSTVSFGSTPGTNVSVVPSKTSPGEQIINVTSPGGLGTVPVTVQSGSKTIKAGTFTYTPVFISISQTSGNATGGTSLVITGAGFENGTTVTFGGTSGTDVSIINSGQTINVTTPPGTGTVPIKIQSGSTTISAGTFSYIPVVTKVSTNQGLATGGTTVTITGAGFSSNSTVSFGSTPGTNVSVGTNGTSITVTSPGGVGTVPVTVTTSGGTSAASSSTQFSYIPVVTSISPPDGSANGGNSVTITGAGFSSNSIVTFGTTEISIGNNPTSTSITVVSPEGIGQVPVTVTTGSETSAVTANSQFTYTPVINSISPTHGPASGGTKVTISGNGFSSDSSVFFGTTQGSDVKISNGGTTITVMSPGGSGVVQVSVTNSAGTSPLVKSSDSFSYIPVVLGLSTSNGPAAGGTQVTITGEGFTGITGVSFGTTKAPSFTVQSNTVIETKTPPGSGTVVVTVQSQQGTSPITTTTADDFTYAPVVTKISPTSGPEVGAQPVVITGSGFTGATSVNFGSYSTTKFTVNSDSSITATSPTASSPGTVDITVTTALGGTSVTTSADQYQYQPSPGAPKLGVTLTPDTSGVIAGANIGYSITASNSGGSTANSATLTDALPSAAGVSWSISSGPSNCSIQNGTLTCGPQALASSGTYSVHITSPTTTATCGSSYATLSDSASLSASNVGSQSQSSATINVVCLGKGAKGQVVDANGTPIPNASVSLCPINPLIPGQLCSTAITDQGGYYSIGNLPSGTYDGTVLTLQGTINFGPVTVSGGIITQIPKSLTQAQGIIIPMPSTVFVKSGTLPVETAANTAGSLPNVLSTAQTTVTQNNACPGSTTATFTVYAADQNPNSPNFGKIVPVPFATNQPLIEVPKGSGNYTGVFPALGQYNGAGKIVMTIPCPHGATETIPFTVYIDPSGTVTNQNGSPISGASVTLLTSPSGTAGTYKVVPSGSAVMSPANRTNPQITDSSGSFGWDVIAGYYEIQVSYNSCSSSPLYFKVPPSLSNVTIPLSCGSSSSSGPTINGAPLNVTASAGNASAVVNWTAPQNGNGITGYQVIPYIGTTAQPAQSFNSTATSENIVGLTNGTTYTFKVAAITTSGVGPLSNMSNPVVPSTVPSAPTNVVASPGNTTATIVWNAPANDGGSPITAYMITPYIGGAAQTPQIFNTNATADSVTGLTNGTTYTFKVAAINAAGTGPNSASSNAVTPQSNLGVAPPAGTGPGSSGGGSTATVNASGGGTGGGTGGGSGGSGGGSSSSSGGGNGAIIGANGKLISPTIGSTALATSVTFNISDTANVVGNLTSGSLYTFIWFFGWLLICVISGRYFFYRRRDGQEPDKLRLVRR